MEPQIDEVLSERSEITVKQLCSASAFRTQHILPLVPSASAWSSSFPAHFGFVLRPPLSSVLGARSVPAASLKCCSNCSNVPEFDPENALPLRYFGFHCHRLLVTAAREHD